MTQKERGDTEANKFGSTAGHVSDASDEKV